jgi:RHS repeat-associated protein
MGWTLTQRDPGGRVLSTSTFGGSALPSPFGSNSNGTGVATTSYSGPVTTVTDQAGATRVTTADALGRLVQVTEDPNNLNYLTAYTYDAQGNLTQVSQGASSPQTRSFVYDTLGRLTTAINPESGSINYTYDDLGRVLSKTDSRSAVINYAYDGLGRLIHKTYSGVTAPETKFCYDGQDPFGLGCPASGTLVQGRLRQTWTSASTSDYSAYDELGRVRTHTQTTNGQAYQFQYQYNLADGLTSLTYPHGRVVTTTYDAAARVSTVQSGSTTYASNIAYAPQGAPNGMNLGNTKFEETCFNTRLQPTGIRVGTATTNGACTNSGDLLNLGLNYGTTANNGNLQSQTIASAGLSSAVSQSYSYDLVNRLTGASEGSNWSRTFGYDAFGNMWASGTGVAMNSFAPLNSNWINSANNQLQNSSLGIGYDAAGNLTAIGAYSLAYDAENRMASANQTAYTYDGDGRRVMKTLGSATTTYVYDAAGQLAAEYESTAPPTPPCTTCYLTADHLGSTRIMTDASGAVISLHDYLPFGEEIPAGVGPRGSLYTDGTETVNDTVAQKFSGKERDNETGFDFFDFRYLSAAQGRFASPDESLTFADPENPQSWNLYSYGFNTPLLYSDPTGHAPDQCQGKDPNYCVTVTATADALETMAAQLQLRLWQLEQQTLQNATDAVWNWLSKPRDPNCVASYTAVGSSIGFWAGGGLGTLGVAGGPAVAATVPGGAAGGAALGGGVGGLAGLAMCSSGTGSGSGGGGRSTGGSAGSKNAGKTVAEILKGKKGSVKSAPLEPGAPSWDKILNTRWEDIVSAARSRQTGYDTIRKLLTDGRFDK